MIRVYCCVQGWATLAGISSSDIVYATTASAVASTGTFYPNGTNNPGFRMIYVSSSYAQTFGGLTDAAAGECHSLPVVSMVVPMSSIHTCDSRVVTQYIMWDNSAIPQPILILKVA
jgi:hypothetical protein